MSTGDHIDDVTIVRTYREACKTMGEANALRHVIAEARRIRAESLPQTIRPVVDAVARAFCLDPELLLGSKSSKPYWEARRVAWWLLHDRFAVGYSDLAEAFCGRDHSTPIKVLQDFESRLGGDPGLLDLMRAIEAEVWRQLGRKAAA